MNVLDRLATIDRRIIFVLIALAVTIPMLIPLRLPVDITGPVKAAYNKIESMPEGSIVVLSIDYDPGSEAELYPATLAFLEHCFRRNLKVYMLALWAPGVSLGNIAFAEIAPKYNKVYGEDYINVGYKPGGAVMLLTLGRNVADVVATDYAGMPIDSFPLGRTVKTSRDMDVVMTFSAGDPGILHWIIYFNARFGVPILGATTAISAPRQYPYLSSGQLTGLLGGLKAAAEYELLVDKKGRATSGMDSQSIAHILIVIFIVIGNLILLQERRRQ